MFLARCNTVRLELTMPDPPDSMAETTEDSSSNDSILAIFSNLDADLWPLGPSSPAVSTDPETIFSRSNSHETPLPLSVSTYEQYSHDSTATIEANDNDITVEVHQPQTYNYSQITVMRTSTSLHPPIPSQLMVALFYHAPFILDTALRPITQSIAANIAESILLQHLQHLSDRESTPVVATD